MIKKARQFLEDVQVEMKKVVWPERDKLINSTVVVIVVSVMFTLFIFFADTIISKLIKILYRPSSSRKLDISLRERAQVLHLIAGVPNKAASVAIVCESPI